MSKPQSLPPALWGGGWGGGITVGSKERSRAGCLQGAPQGKEHMSAFQVRSNTGKRSACSESDKECGLGISQEGL